jgi:hypothetical protein
VLRKFGFTKRKLGVTAHGLRHEALIGEYVVRTGQQPPVRGGAREGTSEVKAACLAILRLNVDSKPSSRIDRGPRVVSHPLLEPAAHGRVMHRALAPGRLPYQRWILNRFRSDSRAFCAC